MIRSISSGGQMLAARLTLPESRRQQAVPGLLVCPSFPSVTNGGRHVAERFFGLADRIVEHLEWAALVLNYRGCGDSEGDFALDAWVEDVEAAALHLDEMAEVSGVWLVGFGTGGAFAVCAAARQPAVRGVATVGAPADFDHWGDGDPAEVVEYARSIGVISTPGFPLSLDDWVAAAETLRVDSAAAELNPRPLLVVHGADDQDVPSLDARVIADAHGSADLRILEGAGHRLAFDPRTVAVLMGWLDSQRSD